MSDRKIKVLLVDDSASMREMLGFTLKSGGYEVYQATDGVEAMAFVRAHQVNLIITDINMPNMDGFSLIRELRKLSNYKFIPILTLTTEDSADKKQQGQQAGATGWIVKPFDPEHLLQTVKRVL